MKISGHNYVQYLIKIDFIKKY